MPDCRQFLNGLCDYLDGTSDAASTAAVECHLRNCPKCRVICATVRETVRIYKRAWPECCVPADVEARLMAAIERLNRHPEARWR